MAKPPPFHTKSIRRRKRSLWKRVLPTFTFLLAMAAAAFMMWLPRSGGEWEQVDTRFSLCGQRGSNSCVIDGDTIMLGKRKIRIAGYNAPEIKGECAAEAMLARKSRDALRDWLNAGAFEMTGGNEPPYDQYGRELRELKRGKEWLSESMIEAELAQESGWGFIRGGWCS